MLKLKHLFNNQDLAYMLLQNYNHSVFSKEDLSSFRISANAVYEYKLNDSLNYMRFTPYTADKEKYLIGEIKYINFLSNKEYKVVSINRSKNNNQYERKSTPWGKYLVTSFVKAEGVKASSLSLSENHIYEFGRALGRLHQLSKLNIDFDRPDMDNIFSNIYNILENYNAPSSAKIELDLIRNYFKSIRKTKKNYGIIHYDFELDNAFYDNLSKAYTIFDFDDSMYHFYVMDINQALESLYENSTIEKDHIMDTFIAGYMCETDFDLNDLIHIHECKKFAALYSYARVLESSYETWDNEPEWMISLRDKFNRLMSNREKSFGNRNNE